VAVLKVTSNGVKVPIQQALGCFEFVATQLEGTSPDVPKKFFRSGRSPILPKSLFAIRYSPFAVVFGSAKALPSHFAHLFQFAKIFTVPSFVSAADECNEVKMMAKVKTRQTKRKVADMTVDELAELVRQILRDELKFLCSVDDEGNLVFWCEEAYARYVELMGKKPSEVRAYWVEGGMKFRYSDDEVTPELAKELDEAKRDIEAGRLIPYEQVRKELGL
jgi:hypothetical protein